MRGLLPEPGTWNPEPGTSNLEPGTTLCAACAASASCPRAEVEDEDEETPASGIRLRPRGALDGARTGVYTVRPTPRPAGGLCPPAGMRGLSVERERAPFGRREPRAFLFPLTLDT